MQVRVLPFLLATLVLALWPQGLVLCFAECGNVEIELAGSPCDPEEGGECGDCIDVPAPDLRTAPVAVSPVTDPCADRAADLPRREDTRLSSTPPAETGAEQDATVLLI